MMMRFATNTLEYTFRFSDMPEEQPSCITYCEDDDETISALISELKRAGAINIRHSGYMYGSD